MYMFNEFIWLLILLLIKVNKIKNCFNLRNFQYAILLVVSWRNFTANFTTIRLSISEILEEMLRGSLSHPLVNTIDVGGGFKVHVKR